MILKGFDSRRRRDPVNIEVVAERFRVCFLNDIKPLEPLPSHELLGRFDGMGILIDGTLIKVTYSIQSFGFGQEAQVEFFEDEDIFDIALSERTEEGLEDGVERATFSLYHEIGHIILHSDLLRELKRMPSSSLLALHKDCRWHDQHSDTEYQADAFAAAMLMPFREMRLLEQLYPSKPFDKVVQQTFRTSMSATRRRIKTYREYGGRFLAP